MYVTKKEYQAIEIVEEAAQQYLEIGDPANPEVDTACDIVKGLLAKLDKHGNYESWYFNPLFATDEEPDEESDEE